MKTKILTLVFVFAFFGALNAECTLTTECGTTIYQGNNASFSSSNGIITVSQNGEVIDTIECEGAASISCSSSDGDGDTDTDFNICDYLPDFLKPYFGC